MEFITERTAIAKALNFGKYPVLTIDLKDRDEYGLVGCKVRVDFGNFSDGEKFYEHAELRVYKDEKVLTFSSYGCCLDANFGYSDIAEMLEYANAPIIKPDQEIIIVITDSVNRTAYPLIKAKTGKINKFCSTPISIEKVDLRAFF